MKDFYRKSVDLLSDGNKVFSMMDRSGWFFLEEKPEDQIVDLYVGSPELPPVGYIRNEVAYKVSPFRKRPYLQGLGVFHDTPKYYFDRHKLQVKISYSQRNFTISEMLEHASSDHAIEYLKERGLAVCPVHF